MRFVLTLLLLVAAIWAPGWLPGRWWVSVVAVLAVVGVIAFFSHWRKRDFVQFEADAAPTITPEPLPPEEKIAVHATGYFSVEGKWQRYTWLPGFYRVFATRERTLMCQVQNKKYLAIGKWPADELGMWYMFFSPQDVVRVEQGTLTFGSQPRPALAIDYRVTVPRPNRIRKEKEVVETIYLAFQEPHSAQRILADLCHDLPEEVVGHFSESMVREAV